MSRYRLRFLLQELDLNGPEVVIGRSPECQITIEDPLVSRQHARIFISDDGARVVDLGSRNGVRINGNLIKGEAPLRHNDRLRLGTQDLVFLVIEEGTARTARATGFMLHCSGCGRPFPSESAACPHCGTEARRDPPDSNSFDTITGVNNGAQAAWTFQLVGEVIERALSTGRASEAERMMQRAAKEVEERLRLGVKLDPRLLGIVSCYAVRLARLQNSADWAEWVLALHREHGVLPSAEVVDHIEQLSRPVLDAVRPLLAAMHLWWSASRAEAANDAERVLSNRVAGLAERGD